MADTFTNVPLERIESFGQISLLYSDLFCVSWILGRYCNYNCSYCWPFARSDEKDHRPLEVICKTIDEIKSQARSKGFNSFHFSFSGGEATLHPKIIDILRYYASDTKNSRYQSVHMTTNLSAGKAWIKKYLEATEAVDRRGITASFHAEHADEHKFSDKILFLKENHVQTTINIVMLPDRFDKLYEIAKRFCALGLNVTLKPQSDMSANKRVSGYSKEMQKILRQEFPQYSLPSQGGKRCSEVWPQNAPKHMNIEFRDEEGKEWYFDQAERFNAYGFNRFKGWDCSAGYRSIIIREPNGEIKRSYSCVDKSLGTIDKGFRLFDDVKPCITERCFSSADSKIPKRKPKSNAPLWRLKD